MKMNFQIETCCLIAWRLTWSIIQVLTTNPLSGPPADLLILHGEHEILLLPAEETVVASVHLSALTDAH